MDIDREIKALGANIDILNDFQRRGYGCRMLTIMLRRYRRRLKKLLKLKDRTNGKEKQ